MKVTPLKPAADQLTGVWRALVDPTRRAILDLLRARARTTGELADAFPAITRFAVMKHLTILADAGLVFVRRRGRERWNHLNPTPIQQIQQRWMRPYEVEAAERLLRLKAVAEAPTEEERAVPATDSAFRTVDIELELAIRAAPEKVWRALTEDIGRWWPAKFYVGKAPIRFAIEPVVGGRVFEDWGDGEGSLWGTVAAVQRNEVLQWLADIPKDYGGPARSFTTFRLVRAEGGTTRLQFRDTIFGELSPQMGVNMEQGWRFLLDDCFRPFVEAGTQPERPETVVANERGGTS